VTLEFVDISDAGRAAEVAAALACAREQRLKPPIVFADDTLLRVPWFSNWTLYDTIEAYIASFGGRATDSDEADEPDLRDYGTD